MRIFVKWGHIPLLIKIFINTSSIGISIILKERVSLMVLLLVLL